MGEEGQDLAASALGLSASFSLPVSGPVRVLAGNPEIVFEGLRGLGPRCGGEPPVPVHCLGGGRSQLPMLSAQGGFILG